MPGKQTCPGFFAVDEEGIPPWNVHVQVLAQVALKSLKLKHVQLTLSFVKSTCPMEASTPHCEALPSSSRASNVLTPKQQSGATTTSTQPSLSISPMEMPSAV